MTKAQLARARKLAPEMHHILLDLACWAHDEAKRQGKLPEDVLPPRLTVGIGERVLKVLGEIRGKEKA